MSGAVKHCPQNSCQHRLEFSGTLRAVFPTYFCDPLKQPRRRMDDFSSILPVSEEFKSF